MNKSVGILLGLASIAVSPWTTYDPINPLKLLMIGICGASCLVYLILNRNVIKVNRIVLVLSAVFVFQAFIALLFSSSSITQGFFGYYGRYFGFFTWLMLFIIMVYFSVGQNIDYVIRVFLFVGSISMVYSLLQYLKKDPAPWDNYYATIFGFLGNPNFQSSFLGLYVISMCVGVIKNWGDKKKILFLLTIIILSMFLIFISSSIQGFFVVSIGLIAILLYILLAKQHYRIFWFAITGGMLFVPLFICGVIGAGPLASVLSKGTLASRGDYWVTAFSMAKANLFTGVGPDQYGTWYRFYRNNEALARFNVDVTSDSAHNGYMDFAANLGVLALMAYVLLLTYALITASRFIKKQNEIDYTHAGLVAMFVSFQAQFLISPNQLGLVIWGWVFLGTLIGYGEMNGAEGHVKVVEKHFTRSKLEVSNPFLGTASLLIGSLIGCLVTAPVVYSSMQFRTALVKSDALAIIAAANNWPRNDLTLNYSAKILFANNLQEQGLSLVNAGLEEFPNSYDLWFTRMSYNKLTEVERNEGIEQLHRLDPLNPQWIPKS
jgi:O-antigen ligase